MKRGSCRREFVIGPETQASLLYESRPAQVSEVPRGRGLRHPGGVHDIADAHFTAQQQMQNAEPRAIRESAEHKIDSRFAHCLYSPKRI
jgi:hypothetical protein